MDTPSFLQIFGHCLLETVGAEIASDQIPESLPAVAGSVLGQWQSTCSPEQQRGELQELARIPASSMRQQADALAYKLASDRSPEVRNALSGLLRQAPATIRHALRRPGDPSGTSVPQRLALTTAEDLLPFLPSRRSRFEPGDIPLAGVDWQLEELLGLGGFGEVWKARNPNLESSAPAALKFCLDPPSARVLRNEARLLDRLMLHSRHPGIVPLRQTYLNAEPPCLEYEFVAGGDLAGAIHEWHRERAGLSPAEAARLVMRLAKIVAFAHQLDPPIVHRDLKPANILIQRLAEGRWTLRVADFGNGGVAASHAIRQTLRGTSQTQMLMAALRGACTPLYASPQQLHGADADTRDDVYAIGVIWHQILTGELTTGRPGGARWPQRLAERGMPAVQLDLLTSCFEDNPDDRPRNAAELAERLATILHDAKTGAPEQVATIASGSDAYIPRRVANSLGMTMLLVQAGTFRMGSPPTEVERGADEGPQHEVTITRPFYMSIYPVTQKLFETVMGYNPSYLHASKGGGSDFPVERVTWDEAVTFCKRLSELPAETEAQRTYRLPTEAEWEYACRGGVPMPFAFGPGISSREANYNGNYPYGGAGRGPYLERTSRVGSYSPNPFGLFDMHGNVWEWCADFYDRHYYRISPRYDPPGPPSGVMRVVRGGSCYNIGRFCRSAYRFGVIPTNRALDIGLRVVMTTPATEQAGGG